MGFGHSWRSISRLALLIPLLAFVAGPSHGAAAAPAGQTQSIVDEIGRQVSQIRGLPMTASTPVSAMPRPALVQRLSRELNTDHAVREFLTSQMLLEVLGALPRGFDLRQLQLRLLDEQTIAVYDFDDKTMLLAAEAAPGGDLGADARLVVAHESTHALQDQAFNLKRILPADPPNSDAATAARALVEGDAMLTMRIWGRQFLRPGEKRALGDDTVTQDPVMDSAPPLVRGELLFPYDAGWVFAQLLYQDGGFEALNQAFARPPTSTEQILHPEKYTAGEQPVAVTIPPLERWLGGSWVTRRTDVFGELVLRLLLEPSLSWPTAEAAAQGWGGDAYTILEDASGYRIVAVLTVWDTEDDAAEMYNAWVKSVPLVFKESAQQTLALPSQTRWATSEYQIQALTTGKTVRLVYAPDTGTLELVDSVLADAATGTSPTLPAIPPGPSNLPAPAAPLPAPVGPPPESGNPPPRIPERPSSQPADTRFSPAVTTSPVPVASPEPMLPSDDDAPDEED